MTTSNSAEPAIPKRCSLPSRLPPLEPEMHVRVQAGGVLGRRAVRLGDVGDDHRAEEHHHHRRVDRVALTAVAGHPPVHEHERRRDDQHEQHLEEVGERVGFSNGCAELVLKKPPPFVPSSLIDLLRGDRPHRDRLRQARDRVNGQVVGEVCDHALGDEHDRAEHRDRREHVQDRAHEVLPEVAEALAAAPDDPADERDRDDDPDAGRQPVLDRQPDHLAEVAHRRLAAVVLPVGVRHERRGGVERHVPRGRVEAERVERVGHEEGVLRAQDQVQEQPAREREDDQAFRVGLPVLLALGIDPQDAVEEALGAGEDRRERKTRLPVYTFAM